MTSDDEYRPRIVDAELSDALRRLGAVVVEGPKYVGKTSTALRQAGSIVRLDDRQDRRTQEALAVDPSILFQGAPPILLDEWQEFPDLWNLVRHEVDSRGKPTQFILTGSSTPHDDVRRHSGAGRVGSIQMRPMTLAESAHSTAVVSLAKLFDGNRAPRAFDPQWDVSTSRIAMAQRIAIGGWPTNIGLAPDDAIANNRDYLDRIAEYDIPAVSGARRQPDIVRKVMRSFARNVSLTAGIKTIADGVIYRHDDPDPDIITNRATTRDHLGALERLRIVEDAPGWSPHLRSAQLANTSPKRHFIDPCLAVAALNIGWRPLADDVLTLGMLFESLAVRDLRVYSQPLRGTVRYYRDSTGAEVDAIVALHDGRWGAIEVKLSSDQRILDRAAARLRAVAARIESRQCAFLAIITNGPSAHHRDDGVNVVPLTMLGP
jgi:predicted AAA+ superfamily ATPase